jgi:hypothetical protein
VYVRLVNGRSEVVGIERMWDEARKG